MFKNCSKCKTVHTAPFGSRCRNMAVVTGYSRDDQKYLKFLEDEYVRREKEDELKIKREGADGGTVDPDDIKAMSHSLREISDRLSNLETNLAKVKDTGHPLDPTATDAAADLLTAPLTRALAHLSMDDTDEGKPLRPETYSQSELKGKNRDYTKMDTVDLLFGWVSVADFLVKSGGDLPGYIRHLKFAAGMLHSRRFYDSGAIEYDRYIIDKFIQKKSGGFEPDSVGSTLTFSPRIIPDATELCHGASLTKGTHSYVASKQTKRRVGKAQKWGKTEEIPADFPSDICFFFNYRNCQDDNCPKAHVCRKCNGRHRADSCKSRCITK